MSFLTILQKSKFYTTNQKTTTTTTTATATTTTTITITTTICFLENVFIN